MDEEVYRIDGEGCDETFILNEFGFEVALETQTGTNGKFSNQHPRSSTASDRGSDTKSLGNCSDTLGDDDPVQVGQLSSNNNQRLENSLESLDDEDQVILNEPFTENSPCSNKNVVPDSTGALCHPKLMGPGENAPPFFLNEKSGREAQSNTFKNISVFREVPEIIVSDCSLDPPKTSLLGDECDGRLECSECSNCFSQASQSFCSAHQESSRIGNETTLAIIDCPRPIEDDQENPIHGKVKISVIQPNTVHTTNQKHSESTPGDLIHESKSPIISEADKNNEGEKKVPDSLDSRGPEVTIANDAQSTKLLRKLHGGVETPEDRGRPQNVRRKVLEERHSSESPEEDGETIVMAGEPPDGGYGWVIVFAVFIISVVHPSVSTCFGLVLAQIQEETGGDLYTNTQLVWIPTILFALRQLLAPASGRLAEHFGIRPVSCTGGLLLSLGLLLAAFSGLRLWSLYLSYGGVMGVGLTLLVPQTVLISQSYFTRKRVAALAIGSMGVSLGSVTMPMLLQWLLTTYGVEATFLLWSGITLQTVVATLLFHPVKRHLKAKPVALKNIRSNQTLIPLRRKSSVHGGSKCNCGSSVCESMSAFGSILPNGTHLAEDKFPTMSETQEIDETLHEGDRSYVKEIRSFSPIKAPGAEAQLIGDDRPHRTFLERTWSNPGVDFLKNSSKKSLNRLKSISERELKVLPVIPEERSDAEGGIFPLQSSHEDVYKFDLRPNSAGVPKSRPGSRSSGRSNDSFATCRDSFVTCRSSVLSDSVYCSVEMLPTLLDEQSISSKAHGKVESMMHRIRSLRKRLPSWQIVRKSIIDEYKELKVSYREVLSQKVFIISCASSCLSRLIYSNFNTFLPLMGEEVGLEDDKVYLLMAVAALDFIAKILTAVISTCTDVSTRTLYVAGAITSTLGCLGVSISHGLTSLLISSGLFGLGLGIQMSTSAVLLVEYLGIRLLGKSFGLTLFFVGTTGLAVMPLGGVLQDAVGNYRTTYYFLTVFATGPALMWTFGLRLIQWMDEEKVPSGKKKRQWFNQTDPLSK